MRLLEIHLEVADVEASLAFYAELISHQRIDRWADGKAAAIILADGSAFGFWAKGQVGTHGGRGGSHVHFAFQIQPDEYANYKAKIETLGLTALEHIWPNGHQSVYFFDADGHQGEFMTCDWLAH